MCVSNVVKFKTNTATGFRFESCPCGDFHQCLSGKYVYVTKTPTFDTCKIYYSGLKSKYTRLSTLMTKFCKVMFVCVSTQIIQSIDYVFI